MTGPMLQVWRELHRLSQTQMSNVLGMSLYHFIRMERGLEEIPDSAATALAMYSPPRTVVNMPHTDDLV